MFSQAQRPLWAHISLLAVLLCLFSFSSLGFSKAVPHYDFSTAERQLDASDIPSKRNNRLPLPHQLQNTDTKLIGIWQSGGLIPEDDSANGGIGWTRQDIDGWVEEAYHGVVAVLPDEDKKRQLLIAALWIPEVGYTMSSSIGGGNFYSAKLYVDTNGLTMAPAWWNKVVQRVRIEGGTPTYHSEDGACFLYERSMGNKLASTDKYPGSMTEKPYMSVYGIRQLGKAPGFVATCGKNKPGSSQLRPDCSVIMEQLGIEVRA